MKKSVKFIQTSILSDTMKFYTLRDIALEMVDHMTSKGDTVELYETREDCMVFRCKHSSDITDDKIIKTLTKSLIHMIEDSDNDIVDYINDQHDFEYSSGYLNAEFFEKILDITRSGRLIFVEIDLQ